MKATKMIGVKEAAKAAGISTRRMYQLLADHRVPGAQVISGVWVVPEGFKIQPAERRRPGKIQYA